MAYSMTAAQAAGRLGVKQATLYAYVSRGVLGRGKAVDGRGSLFDPDEVEYHHEPLLPLGQGPDHLSQPGEKIGLKSLPAR